MTQNDFNKIPLSAMDEGPRLRGDSSKQDILFRVETSFRPEKENIPSNLTEVKKAFTRAEVSKRV